MTEDHSPIRQWAEEDRPREKLLLKGKHSLSDSELLAILMGSGSKNETVVDLAKRILRDNENNLLQLSYLDIPDLLKYKGVGEAKAISIIAALEIGNRIRSKKAVANNKITSSQSAYDYLQGIIGSTHFEKFYIVLLNHANVIIRTEKISEGGFAGTVADPKKIFRIALNYAASSIILCHNHPSGNTTPSNQDIALTKQLVDGGKLLTISIIDHIIIGKNTYYSFADEGRI